MPEQIDFLAHPTNERIRKEIVNLSDSYNHPWDVLAELCQNAVDGIRLWNKNNCETEKDHEIIIEVDCLERNIEVFDSGIGIEPNIIPNLLAPHGTDKDTVFDQIGQKGVGITYAIFESEKFELETINEKGKIVAKCNNCLSWKKGAIDDRPRLEIVEKELEEYPPESTYTHIKLQGIEKKYEDKIDIFHQNVDRIHYLLRSKTAIGYTEQLFDKGDLNVKVTVKVTDLNGDTTEEQIPFKYYSPQDLTNDSNIIDLDSFVSKAATMSDRQKAQKLQGKCLMKKGSKSRAGRTIYYYAFFVPERQFWKDAARSNGLIQGQESDEDENSGYDLGGGIFTATKGMPTGIELVPPATGVAGYWPNIFMLIEDDGLSFDLGRKSIPGPTQGMLKDIAKKTFNDVIKWKQYVGKKSPSTKPSVVSKAEREEIFDKLNRLNNLSLDDINFLKYPNNQEAGVIGIFHELLGANLLIGYHALTRGYRMTYDFWGKYRIHKSNLGSMYQNDDNISENIDLPIVIEFKHDCSSILEDVSQNRKYFNEIDLIVCWDIKEDKFSQEGVEVRVLPEEEVFFYGSNYELIWPGAYDLGDESKKPVLALRKFIEDKVRSTR